MIKRITACFILLCLMCISAAAAEFYWENPQTVVTVDSRFPSVSTNGTASIVIWQEIQEDEQETGTIWLSARIWTGVDWIMRERFAGPFPYAGEVPSISSVTLDSRNRILVSVVSGENNITVLTSQDWGASFSPTFLATDTAALLAPKITIRSDGGYFLFATRGDEESFSIVYSRSENGRDWTPVIPFSPATGKKRTFLPAHAFIGSIEVVVFQAFFEGASRSSYQLYSSISRDRGLSWSSPELLTGFTEPGAAVGSALAQFENYHNQRARLENMGGSLALVWERARTANEKYQIYYTQIANNGKLSAPVELVSSGDGFCFDPDIIMRDGLPTVVWFDNRSGVNRVYLARKEGILWTESNLSRTAQDAVFARLLIANETIEVYWQQNQSKGTGRIIRLSPDHSVASVSIVAGNFTPGEKTRGDLVRATVRMPEDSSGIAGYAYSWGFGKPSEVSESIQHLPEESRINVEAQTDGSWYLGVRVADYAGNWSTPTYVEYIRDTTPPAMPIIANSEYDANGFLSSNSFTLSWKAAEEDDIAGYTWSFEYLSPLDYLTVLSGIAGSNGRTVATPALFDFPGIAAKQLPVPLPPSSICIKTPTVTFTNRDNGIYALSVASVDAVGNIGKPSVRYYALNKYVPYTFITYIDSKVDESGVINLSIIGRGFADKGNLSEIYFDKDGKSPYDLTLNAANGQFRTINDRLVTGIKVADMMEGQYRIGLVHPARGLYFSKPLLTVTTFGTVKFGDYGYDFVPPWKPAPTVAFTYFRLDFMLMYSILAFALAVFFFSVNGISGAARDAFLIQSEVRALLTGDIMPSEKKKRSVSLRKKGVSLRFKFAFFTMSLVISVVLIVSIPLGVQFSANQEKTLAQGLESRVKVLLESLTSGARAYLPSQNVLELGFLPAQMTALDEALNATITGNYIDGSATGIEFVWATNDPAIGEKIDPTPLVPGRSHLESPENDEINKRVDVLEEQATLAVSELSEGITALTQEGIKLALNTDAESVARRDEIQTISRQLEEKLAGELTKLSNSGTGSFPQYDPQQLSRDITKYVFYKPVLYRQGSSPRYVHGTVRVEISTASLLKTVDQDRQSLIQTTVFIALFAVLMGLLGSLLLASIIISPIRKLAAHVAMIRDTEDKSLLEGKELRLKSRDEIGLLGETINEMTHGLVKAAAASKDLTVGKDLQKMFIPLETDAMGRKLTCGSTKDDNAEFFGYYEGAKGVSGDYFDYIKLDQRHYAIIKCDIAGKGVPAALIMVEVATMFLDYFKDWKYEKNGFKLEYIVSRINDLIESRGFKGRFAAFTLCILDSVSGDVHFCNAGDNLVHIYDAASRKMKLVTLPECSAAGVFPSFMIDAKGGFRVVTEHLNPGDVLFLYTDGIEEAKRLFRKKDMTVFVCAEPGLEKEAPHESHSVGQDNEELGPERVVRIIEAVFARKPFVLVKWHNSELDEKFEFDFDKCEGTIEEAILALVSVEKIFRMYRDPSANEFNRVQVDRKVDLFLNKYFRQYDVYCGNRKDHPEYPEYLNYTNICEDSQYDDLTILGIRKR